MHFRNGLGYTWKFVELQMTKNKQPEKVLRVAMKYKQIMGRGKEINEARRGFSICTFLCRITGRILKKVSNPCSFWHKLCQKGKKVTCCNCSLFP